MAVLTAQTLDGAFGWKVEDTRLANINYSDFAITSADITNAAITPDQFNPEKSGIEMLRDSVDEWCGNALKI